ncbi:MAG: serine/threonine protein kinase [Myxococcales bacterium]|nr:serine/threonine protein kinase [Myxococcales bacterium]
MKVVANVEYEKLEEIGAGEGMNSKVYLATDPQLSGPIAVKEIPKKDFGNQVNLYFAEAQAMYKTRHDNIVPVHYACETDSHVCIAMPFFKRGSFARLVKSGPAPLSLVLSTGRAVLKALAQVHLANLLHLDVKPSNVLLSDKGVPMLADFGQARQLSSSGVATASRLYYLAVPPEAHLHKGAVALPSDIFQAGVLLYRAANGDPFFKQQWNVDHAKQSAAVVKGRFPRRDLFLPHVPQRLRTVIRRALKVRPEDRYQSAVEFADALGKVACPINWQTKIRPDGAYCWEGIRDGQPTLLVLAQPADTEWNVEVYTEGERGARRAKGKSTFWRRGLAWPKAVAHLTEVFENLR